MTAGNITEADMPKWMNDQEQKVRFEMNNFVVSANRTTSGKMTSFCPVLTKEDFGADTMKMLLTGSKLAEAMGKIEEVDFGISNGYKFAEKAISTIVSKTDLQESEL